MSFTLTHMNRLNKTESVNFVSLVCPLLSKDLHSELIGIPCESSTRQRIHMKKNALFSSKGKSKKLKCRLLQFVLKF